MSAVFTENITPQLLKIQNPRYGGFVFIMLKKISVGQHIGESHNDTQAGM